MLSFKLSYTIVAFSSRLSEPPFVSVAESVSFSPLTSPTRIYSLPYESSTLSSSPVGMNSNPKYQRRMAVASGVQ